MSPIAGRVGHYEVEREVGRGGMGIVYLARDTRLDRRVAVKALPESLSGDPERLARFVREAKILASLNHPNIGAIYGLEELPSGERLLVLEFVDGEPLSTRLLGGPFPPIEAIRVGAEIAEGVGAAHERGIVHRDLKPGNVMLTRDGRVKVLDFGLAKFLRSAGGGAADESTVAAETTITAPGTILGTVPYMAPERLRGGAAGASSDVFAWGCVLFECLTGRRAFQGGSLGEVVAAILTGEPAWSALPLDTPVGVRRLLEQCLEKEPDRRPADARILRERILGLTRMGTSPERAAAPEPAHNLPADLTRFIGRKSEVDACASLLGTSRLLTLTGIGGAGKTRLALRLARECLHRFPDGVWLVDLSVVSDPDRVGLTAATALGVPEAGGRSIEEVLAEHLGSRCALLVLDNCEHVRNACTALARALLGAAPHVRLVATSREALGVAGEQIYALPPLGLPTEPSPGTFDEGALSDAERLFADRATLVAPTFSITSENAADVRDICRTLDGIPLAIELAAARLNVLSTSELRERLDDRFRLLTRGATLAPRHQALRETIQWSYDHLSPAERRLLRRMSVFVGGWTLRAATAVAADGMDEFGVLNLLSRLSEQSLLLSTRHERVESRYRMLETVRQFSIERLKEEGEERAASERHLDYFVEWTEEARPHLSGTADEAWLARIDLERENVLAAHAACDGIPGGAERGLRLLWAIRLYWGKRGLVGLGLRQGLAALGRSGAADAAGSAPWRSDLLFTTAWLAYFHGRYEEAEALADESLACCRDRGDRFGAANALAWMGAVSLARGALDPARARLDEAVALAREPGNRPILAPALHNFGSLKLLEGDAAAAVSCFSEALALSREGGRLEGVVVNLLALARVEIGRGRLDEARERLVEGLRLAEEHSMRVRGQALLDESAAWAAVRGAHALAARLWGAAEAARRSMGLSREPTDEAFLAPRIGRARDTLGAEAFAWEEGVGAALPFEEALSQSRAGLERGASP